MKCPFLPARPTTSVVGLPREPGRGGRSAGGASAPPRPRWFTSCEDDNEEIPYMVVKKDGRREAFDRKKLRAGPREGVREAAGGAGAASTPS